jgi:hypothetical protein
MKPTMDWQQVALNGGPPCFYVEGSKYCGRAERWAGHDGEHKFISLEDMVQQAIADEQKRCWEIATERAAFNRRMAQTFKIGDPMADLKHTRADEGDIIANEIAAIRRDDTADTQQGRLGET